MENSNDVLDVNSGENRTPEKKPVFLKVLCILTFVGSGLGLLTAVFGLLGSGMSEESFRMSQRLLSDSPFDDFMSVDFEEMIRWQRYGALANLVGSILCLTGAFLMWNLKKVGYYLYIPGWIIPVTVGAIGMQYIMSGWLANFGVFGVVVNVLFAAAFIIMYGVNYKHLK